MQIHLYQCQNWSTLYSDQLYPALTDDSPCSGETPWVRGEGGVLCSGIPEWNMSLSLSPCVHTYTCHYQHTQCITMYVYSNALLYTHSTHTHDQWKISLSWSSPVSSSRASDWLLDILSNWECKCCKQSWYQHPVMQLHHGGCALSLPTAGFAHFCTPVC